MPEIGLLDCRGLAKFGLVAGAIVLALFRSLLSRIFGHGLPMLAMVCCRRALDTDIIDTDLLKQYILFGYSLA